MGVDPNLPPTPPVESDDEIRKKDRKSKKVRSAWIAFFGRIVAQVIGAAATVALGLMIAERVHRSEHPGPNGAGAVPVETARARTDKVAIAVLPLDNFSGDPGQDYFADGLTEALTADLARIRALHVISRTSAMQYKGTRKPMPQIARELGVDVVIEGSVVLSGKRVRVTAQLVDAREDRHLWTRTYDRDVRDLLEVQSDIARNVAREVHVALSPQETMRLSQARPVDAAAHALYLKGRHEWNKRTQEGFAAARLAFEQAIVRDPSYAPAYAGLADAWNVAAWSFYDAADPRVAMPKARAAAEKALALDDSLGEAHASLGAVLFRYDWDFVRAEAELRRALDLDPGYTTGRQWLAVLHAALGRHDAALAEALLAHELDPLSPVPKRTAAAVLYYGGRLPDAERTLRAEIAAGPVAPAVHQLLAEVLLAGGRAGEAAAVLREAFGPTPAEPGPRLLLAVAQGTAGDRTMATAAVEDIRRAEARGRHLSPRSPALLFAQLGDKEAALRVIERGVTERSEFAVWLKVHPLLGPVRADPRFQVQLKRVGFPST